MLFENWISQILVQKEVLGLPTRGRFQVVFILVLSIG